MDFVQAPLNLRSLGHLHVNYTLFRLCVWQRFWVNKLENTLSTVFGQIHYRLKKEAKGRQKRATSIYIITALKD